MEYYLNVDFQGCVKYVENTESDIFKDKIITVGFKEGPMTRIQ